MAKRNTAIMKLMFLVHHLENPDLRKAMTSLVLEAEELLKESMEAQAQLQDATSAKLEEAEAAVERLGIRLGRRSG